VEALEFMDKAREILSLKRELQADAKLVMTRVLARCLAMLALVEQ